MSEIPGLACARRVHWLRTFPEFFEAVIAGRKRAELRFNDRGFREGDVLRLVELEEADPRSPATGREFDVLVTHLLEGGEFGLGNGYVMLSIRPLDDDFIYHMRTHFL